MTVCAVILARNEAGNIQHALETAGQVCDHCVVIDTGSEDDTREQTYKHGLYRDDRVTEKPAAAQFRAAEAKG